MPAPRTTAARTPSTPAAAPARPLPKRASTKPTAAKAVASSGSRPPSSIPPSPIPAAAAPKTTERPAPSRMTSEPPPAPARATAPPPQPMRPSRPPSLRPASTMPPPPPGPPIKLKVGDKAVHPAHGVGEVTAIDRREIGGTTSDFYVIKILDNGMKVMVPVGSTGSQLRAIMTSKEADGVIETMRAREVAVDLQPWSRRFRAYTEMIKSGSPHEVAKVLRDMYRLKFDKDLSFGERRLLDQAKSLLMKELAAAKGVAEPILQAQVDDMFRA